MGKLRLLLLIIVVAFIIPTHGKGSTILRQWATIDSLQEEIDRLKKQNVAIVNVAKPRRDTVELIYKNDIGIYMRDTVVANNHYKIPGGFYVMGADGTNYWLDLVFKVKELK